MKKFLLLLIAAFITLTYAEEHSYNVQKISHSGTLHFSVLKTINFPNDISSLQSKEFLALKTEISQTWEFLVKNEVIEIEGQDKDIRPIFVSIQAIVENVLSSEKEIKVICGIIHTPMPATPLCISKEISSDLIDPSIEKDPYRLFTIKARKTIIRDYLSKGGALYIAYPEEGLKKRTPEQQNIYKQELKNYSSNLFDVPLSIKDIPNDLIGATYFFQDCTGKTFVFSIKMTQANDPKENGSFALWLGPIDHFAIQKRIKALGCYLEKGGFDINILINKP